MGNLINNAFANEYLKKSVDNLNIEKELILKSLIISYLIMVRRSDKIDEFANYFIPIINELKLTEYGILYDYLIEYVYRENKNVNEIIDNYIINGYYFHTTHDVLAESILLNNPKPWGEQRLEEVQKIFKSRGKHDVFGLYKKDTDHTLFLASSLETSSYYGITSPSWFTHFTSGGLKKKPEYKKFGFYNRDYKICLNNVINLCKEYNLNKEEEIKVIDFFEDCYAMFGNSCSPKVILFDRKKVKRDINIPPMNKGEKEIEYLKRIIKQNCSTNALYRNKINKEDVLLVEYQKKEKEMVL